MNLRKPLLMPTYLTIKIQFKFDMKKTWDVLSEILNRSNRNSVPDNITVNNDECSDKQAIAEHFNSFFASVGELNCKNITEHGDSIVII